MKNEKSNLVIWSTIIVAALGYFVDIYDLLLFSIIRVESLKAIGITDSSDLQNMGLSLLNWQMLGMLIGGLGWGILGDKKGRLSVLFGSIILYSIANIANGFVETIEQYKVLRFIAGIGLAGELGAGITLVSEIMSKEKRGYGTTIVASVGILGAVAAYFVSQVWDWRTAYFVGGGLGLALLVLRISVFESGMFNSIKDKMVERGNFLQLFQNKERFFRYMQCILVGLPTWFVVGILITFAPEFSKAFGMTEAVATGGAAIMYCYTGLTLGDLTSGIMSQLMKSRKKALLFFHLFSAATIVWYLTSGDISQNLFYLKIFLIGFGVGYWAIFVTIAAENFGTNLRATVTTTVPNFARGALVLIVPFFKAMKVEFGQIGGAYAVGATCVIIALTVLYFLPETYGKDLDYVEE
ncbi:MAG: MFS transporter [Saprospiraceae bacterium]|nr:MFS transporter [Saprospiraceae bacterium]MCF8248459.1 MFS transporter [Saprospiraceae bacterium]MCF8283205.1 MFS transporter [Bacteroidales bacterium]MCF8309987.1 MFS transporter [Saprospiraceae bacterium]MCF8438682.1 MFS transporter [Saprospiraceae bacterium]